MDLNFGKSLGLVVELGFWEELRMGRWVGILGRAPGESLGSDFGKSLGWIVGFGFWGELLMGHWLGFWEELLVGCWIRILGRDGCLSSFHCYFSCSFNPFSSLLKYFFPDFSFCLDHFGHFPNPKLCLIPGKGGR